MHQRPGHQGRGATRPPRGGPRRRFLYHPPLMRRAGPILIIVIGLLALIVDFVPGLSLPDSSAEAGTNRPIETKLGLDLQGGLRVEYQAQQVGDKIPRPEDLEVIRTIIENRVNATGVSEPLVTTQGADRIVVELPGVSDPESVRKLVGQTGRLDFVPLGTTQKVDGDTVDEKQFPPLFSGEQLDYRRDRHRPARQARRDVPAQGCRREALRRLHRGAYRAVLRDRPGRQGDLGAADPRRDPRWQRPDQPGQLDRRLSAQGGDEPRHGPPVRLAAVPGKELSSQTISATLGEQFFNQSLLAGAVGILLVILFMLIYYRLPGVVASFALVYYTLVVLALFRADPRHPDPRRDRRLRPVDRHGGRRQHPDLRADEGGDARRQVARRRRSRQASAGRGTRSSTPTCRA